MHCKLQPIYRFNEIIFRNNREQSEHHACIWARVHFIHGNFIDKHFPREFNSIVLWICHRVSTEIWCLRLSHTQYTHFRIILLHIIFVCRVTDDECQKKCEYGTTKGEVTFWISCFAINISNVLLFMIIIFILHSLSFAFVSIMNHWNSRNF